MQARNNRPRTYIDHVYRNKKPCGYCHYRLHKGYLTVRMVRTHKCTVKNCRYFEKFNNHRYWIDKEEKKQMKKERKRKLFP